MSTFNSAEFEQTSLENFYHYLIMTKFVSAPSDKKNIFLQNLVQRNIREPNVFNTLMETQTIDEANDYVSKLPKGSPISKNPLDLYCSESDPETAFYLLRFLMFTPIEYDGFHNIYSSLKQEEKKMYLPTNIWNAEFL